MTVIGNYFNIEHNVSGKVLENCLKADCPFLVEIYPDFPEFKLFLCKLLAEHLALSQSETFCDPGNTKEILTEYFKLFPQPVAQDIPESCRLEYYMDV